MTEEKEESERNKEKEQFVKIMKYSTPITVGLLLYVGLAVLDGELILMIPITLMIVIEVVIGLEADKIYEKVVQE